MNNDARTFRKDIVMRAMPGLAGIACIVVAFRMTIPTQATFVLLVMEGVVLIGLAVFLVRRYLRTPPST